MPAQLKYRDLKASNFGFLSAIVLKVAKDIDDGEEDKRPTLEALFGIIRNHVHGISR